MKQPLHFFALIVLFTTVFSSCTIQKRLYRPGYHLEWNRKTDSKQAAASSDEHISSSESEFEEEPATATRYETTTPSIETAEARITSKKGITSPTTDNPDKTVLIENLENDQPLPFVEEDTTKPTFQQLLIKDTEHRLSHQTRIILAFVFLLVALFPLSVYLMDGDRGSIVACLLLTSVFLLCILSGVILILSPAVADAMVLGVAGLLIMAGILAGIGAFITAVAAIFKNIKEKKDSQ